MFKKHEVMRSYLDKQTMLIYLMIISTIQNVVWPNYYRNIVNGIPDNKALYANKTLE